MDIDRQIYWARVIAAAIIAVVAVLVIGFSLSLRRATQQHRQQQPRPEVRPGDEL